MKITKEIFQDSFFNIGGGFDVQPMLRFTHRCTHFLNVNLGIDKPDVLRWYDKELSKYDFEVVDRIVIDDFRKELNFELSPNYMSDMNPSGFMTTAEFADYQYEFNQCNDWPQYGIAYKIYRRCVNRTIWFYFLTAEGIASYLLLSQKGKYAPRVLCTIQTGVLEDPVGIFNNLYSDENMSRPEIWIRGFEPRSDSRKTRNVALDTDGVYKNRVLDFNMTWLCGKSYPRQKRNERFCKGFMSNEGYKSIQNREIMQEYLSGNHSFLREDINSRLENSEDIDIFVISKRMHHYYRTDILNIVDQRILYWEDIMFGIPSSLRICAKSQISTLRNKLLALEITSESIIHIVPYCFEDQGEIYFEAIREMNYKCRTYIPNAYDIVDLKDPS